MGHHAKKKPKQPSLTTKEKLKLIRKEKKQKLKQKRARLVIRNLSFDATEENVKEYFKKFGEVEDVQILKKEDGKLIGCGFVQFKLVQKAAKARHHLNAKEFLGRELIVDFALAKNKYEQTKVEIKEEPKVEIKEEPVDCDESQESIDVDDIKVESDNEVGLKSDGIEEVKEEKDDDDKAEKMTNESDDDDDDDDEEKESSEDSDEESQKQQEDPPAKKAKFESNDVSEGKTIFIKNVPFSATNEDLKQCMKQFGPVYYALICIDKFTEHSKGTAFVKFVNAEDAEKALAAGTELTLLGNVLDCHKAVGRNELKHSSNSKQKEVKKDSRNLYLVKEGVILAGSKAAEGVSASDMAKRLQLEQYKTQMLRNLNMFVSPVRLAIHNLPPTWDDKKLRSLIKNNSPKNSVIKEARIMRDLKNVDASGIGKSKEFGFVTFTNHEDALATLRKLNNNPKIFSVSRRPIVAFSIENRTMIKAKEKRLEKSRLKNPKCKDFDPEVVQLDEEKKEKRLNKDQTDEEKEYMGMTAKPGVQKARSRYNLKTQAKLHYENLKKEKKKLKMAKKPLAEKKKDFTKLPKQKINKKKQDDNFAKLVSDYKKKLMAVPEIKKTKWYD